VPPVGSRRVAPGIAYVVALVGAWVVVSASGACVATGASLGQSCLKDSDCFSGHCAAQICVAAAPELSPDAAEGDSTVADAPGAVEGSSTDDGPYEGSEGSTGPTDGGSGGGLTTADTSASDGAADGPGTTGADASPDGPGDGTTDAPPDAPADGASDARLDSGAG
jgi:hypothetical protein